MKTFFKDYWELCEVSETFYRKHWFGVAVITLATTACTYITLTEMEKQMEKQMI